MSFKVGDWVVRKAEARDARWPFGAVPVRINWLADDGLELRVNGSFAGWSAQLFDLYSECHTDADLAMALQLADLLHENASLDDWWDVVETQHWLRDQVRQELLHREAR